MKSSHVSQTVLGKWFGISAKKVGKILVQARLKDRNGPTNSAILEDYAREVVTPSGISFFVWDAKRVAKIIDDTLGDSKLEELASQYGWAIAEAERHRADGKDFIADMLQEQAYDGLPSILVGIIQDRLS